MASATSFAVDQIAAALRADFADRSITAAVLVGEWETEKFHDAPQVVIGLDKFRITPPGGTKFGGGGWFPVNDDGTLTYSFVETLVASHPGFIVRLVGGAIFLSGMFLMAYNTWRTVRSAQPAEVTAAAQMA